MLVCRLSNTLDTLFCVEALRESLRVAQLVVFNTDQGAQFTIDDFTGCLNHEVLISMDDRGRALENVFVERLRNSVKYAVTFLRDKPEGRSVSERLQSNLTFYNHARRHSALGRKTPADVHDTPDGLLRHH